jgi:hypothetical protein
MESDQAMNEMVRKVKIGRGRRVAITWRRFHLIERRQIGEIRLQHDLDAPILRLMLGGIVFRHGVELLCRHNRGTSPEHAIHISTSD